MDLVVFLPLILIMGAFMFFASRKQKKAMQATIDLHESLSVGDRIHTTSGLQGTITGISDDNIELEIAPGVITTWMKLAVRDRIETPPMTRTSTISTRSPVPWSSRIVRRPRPTATDRSRLRLTAYPPRNTRPA